MERALDAGMQAVRDAVAKSRSNLMRRLRELPHDGSAERERADIIAQLDAINPQNSPIGGDRRR